MKVAAAPLDHLQPKIVLKLFQDGNGNWFVSGEERSDQVEYFHTSTFDSPFEAIQAAVHRLKL